MRRNVAKVILGGFVAALLGLTGCGSGGDSGGSGGSSALSSFTTTDFSGKSVYLVDGSSYQLGTFYSDGTAKASNQMTTGTPTLLTQTATWTITNGKLVISSQGDTVQYSPISNDTGARYFKVTKNSSNGVVNTVGMYYDQSSALDQAKNFVATHRLPEGGPCDGVDTTKTPDYISLGMVGGKVTSTSTWGACTK